MSGISSSTGLISGINTEQIISQLLAIEARPRTLAQRRVAQLQGEQAAYLDLNSRLSTLRSAATSIRTGRAFEAASVSTANDQVLTGSARPGAALGTFTFLIDRVVSTQQSLSRGYTDRTTTAVGATSITVEPAAARLDRGTELVELNGGAGVRRGRIALRDSAGAATTVDLSRAATVDEVLEAINTNGVAAVTARVSGGRLVLTDAAGGAGALQVRNGQGSFTATDLGINTDTVAPSGATLTGAVIYRLGDGTSLQSLNDGNGLRFNPAAGAGSTPDFTIKTRDGSTYSIDVSAQYEFRDGAFVKTAGDAATVEQLKQRIAAQTQNKVSLQVSADGARFQLVDASTPTGVDDFQVIDLKGAAAGLGLVATSSTDTITGSRVLASLNSTLASNLAGGAGLASGAFQITARTGQEFTFSVATDASISEILDAISAGTGGRITGALNASGTGLVLTDTTGASTSNLIIKGAGATALGVATAPAGVAATTVSGSRLQHRYVGEATLLSSLNGGRGVGTGEIRLTDQTGTFRTINIGDDARTVGDVIDEINSIAVNLRARINDRGDGILIEKRPGAAAGNNPIKIEDRTGGVAAALNLAGTAADGGSGNVIDGSFERTVALGAGDSLDQVVTKINDAGPGVTASVIQDGSAGTPYRLRLTAAVTGKAGAYTIDTAGADLGFSLLSRAADARVFFGNSDPALGVLIQSSSNTIDGVLEGVALDIRGVSDQAVQVTVGRDTTAAQSAVDSFVSAFNGLADRLATLTEYNADTERGGTLLGDSTAQELRRSLFDLLIRPAKGVGGRYRYLSEVGVRVSEGKLEVDQDKLRAAIEADPAAVEALFSARTQDEPVTSREIAPGITVRETPPATFSKLGVAEKFAEFVSAALDAGGVITRRTTRLNDQVAFQNDRIEAFDQKLSVRRAILERQFANLESTLAELQRQQSALSSIGARSG